MNDAAPWWENSVTYQIYPRSFLGTTGSGYGTLDGITSRLDYLAWLGVDALWLSPIFPSPGVDGGYDVADYRDVDPLFGSLADCQRLIEEAHARGIRVLLDWVANHTSDKHEWFESSRTDPSGPHGDWYWWADKPANNWISAFGGSAWTYDEVRGQYYLHLFAPAQPDLNWNIPGVKAAMLDTLRFWLDLGVDGFRADVVHLIGRDPALESLPHLEPHAGVSLGLDDLVHNYLDPLTHEHLQDIRSVLDEYPGDRVIVGEVALGPQHSHEVPDYLGSIERPELSQSFEFSLMGATWEPSSWRETIAASLRHHGPRASQPRGTRPAWVLSNHDASRLRTRLGGGLASEARARAATTILLTLPGSAYLYAGDEWGLEDAEIPEDRRVDMIGRDVARAPLPWDETPAHGWPVADPWLPWPPETDLRNAQTQQRDNSSFLNMLRELLTLRRTRLPRSASLSWVASAHDVLAYEITDTVGGSPASLVVVNFGDTPLGLEQALPGFRGSRIGECMFDSVARHPESIDGGMLVPYSARIFSLILG